jgi:hypothetical protein
MRVSGCTNWASVASRTADKASSDDSDEARGFLFSFPHTSFMVMQRRDD